MHNSNKTDAITWPPLASFHPLPPCRRSEFGQMLAEENNKAKGPKGDSIQS